MFGIDKVFWSTMRYRSLNILSSLEYSIFLNIVGHKPILSMKAHE